jgi:hypothetical protein
MRLNFLSVTLPNPQINALMEKPPRCLATMKLSQKPQYQMQKERIGMQLMTKE